MERKQAPTGNPAPDKNVLAHSAARVPSERRLEFETLLADISARFVSISPEQVDDAIRDALTGIMNFFDIDPISLLRLMPDKSSFIVSHNADVAGQSPYPVMTLVPVSVAGKCRWSSSQSS